MEPIDEFKPKSWWEGYNHALSGGKSSRNPYERPALAYYQYGKNTVNGPLPDHYQWINGWNAFHDELNMAVDEANNPQDYQPFYDDEDDNDYYYNNDIDDEEDF